MRNSHPLYNESSRRFILTVENQSLAVISISLAPPPPINSSVPTILFVFEYYVMNVSSVKNLKSRLFTSIPHYNVTLSSSFTMPSPTPPKINLEDVSINKAQVELQRAITQLEMAKKKKDADFQMHVAARQSSDRQPSAHRVQVKGGSPAVTPDMEEPTVSKPTPNSKTAGGKEKERRLDSEGSEEAGQVEEELMELKLPLSSKTVGRKGKERELDDSEEEGESKKSGEEEEEGSDGEKDGEDDDETDGEDEEEVDELEGEEPVKSQGAPPAQKESGKGLSKQKVVPGRPDCFISSIFFFKYFVSTIF